MQHFSYFAKAYAGALYAGLIYLMSVIAPTASHLGDITLLQWIGFVAITLGTFGGVSVVTNGPKPGTQNPDGSYKITNLPAAPETKFPAAKVEAALERYTPPAAAFAAAAEPVLAPPVAPAPEVPVPTV